MLNASSHFDPLDRPIWTCLVITGHFFRIDPDSNEEDELEAFSDIDGDSNGHIDMAEMQRWLYPSDYDPAETEFHHLLTEADTDMDGRLSKDEILENYHVLLESEATRWGAMGHEEL